LITGDAHPAKVTGIMKDIPENSHIKADVVISMTTITQKFAQGIDSQWAIMGPPPICY
jgi:putative ABC transport system permease protein